MQKILTYRKMLLIDQNQTASAVSLVTLNNFGLIVWPCTDEISFESVPCQLSTVIDAHSGFDG
jgi:hypothetical protein